MYERETNPTHVGRVTWDSLYLTESSVLIIVIPPLSLGLGQKKRRKNEMDLHLENANYERGAELRFSVDY